jgi:8-oxo-dGTP diphosphatase
MDVANKTINETEMYRAMVGIIGFYEEKLLIIQRSCNSRFLASEWTFPTGKIEFGESARETVLKELHEETGLNCKIVGILNFTEFIPLKKNKFLENTQINYLVILDSNRVNLNEESQNYCWIELNDYAKSKLNDYNKKIIFKSLKKLNNIKALIHAA